MNRFWRNGAESSKQNGPISSAATDKGNHYYQSGFSAMTRCGERFRVPGRSSHENWRSRSPQIQPITKQTDQRKRVPNFSGEFVCVDPNAKFLEDEQVEGIHLLTDFDKVRQIQIQLGKFAHGPEDFFPVMWPVTATGNNIFKITWGPHVVAPKPTGPRYLFYVDSVGDIFLENMAQHIFYLNRDRAFKFFNARQQPIVDTVLDGVITREKSNRSGDCKDGGSDKPYEKLTFVINDAVRCNGVDLTNMGILERMDVIQKEIIMPRAVDTIETQQYGNKEIFKMEMVEYKKITMAEDYLSIEFGSHYKYPLRCLVFVPQRKGIECGTCQDVIYWAENDTLVFSFRLEILHPIEGQEQAQLLVIGSNKIEIPLDWITLTDELRKLDGRIIDCYYDNNQWTFIKVRHDRQHPNGITAVLGKIQSIRNPVSRHLLLATCKKCENVE